MIDKNIINSKLIFGIYFAIWFLYFFFRKDISMFYEVRIRYFDVEIGWFFGRLYSEFWFVSSIFDFYNKIFIIYLSRIFPATILTALYCIFNIYILIRNFEVIHKLEVIFIRQWFFFSLRYSTIFLGWWWCPRN